MPSSKQTAAQASAVGRGAAKAPTTAREAKRAAPKGTQAPQNDRLERRAPQEPSAYAASAWGTQTQFEVTTPSGQMCLCRELTVERLIEMGLLQAINSLESLVGNQVLPKAEGQPVVQVDMGELMANPEKLTAVLDLVNTIVVEAVVAPQIYPVPAEGEQRVNGLIYVDSIGMTDRFAIFGEVTGGLENLSQFR